MSSRPSLVVMYRPALPAVLALVSACTEDPVEPTAPVVAEIVIAGIPATLEEGDTVRLSATLSDRDGTVITGVPVQWSSEDPAVATVSTEALVTAVAAGTARIRATAAGGSATGVISVINPTALRFATLVTGPNHTCGLTSDGALYCWGYNNYGQLGTTNMGDGRPVANWQGKVEEVACSARPIRVHGPAKFTAVALGIRHTCALTPAGSALCWGSNHWEQLGTSWDLLLTSAAPITVPGQFGQVSAGNEFSCALTSAGKASCWGSHSWGQLATGDLELFTSPTPVSVVGGHAFTMLTGGSLHNCGLLSSGVALCWGGFESGEIGIGHFRPPDLWWPFCRPTLLPEHRSKSMQHILAGSRLRWVGPTLFW